tara:strand:+ start:508 stop:1437 length:930 start_codon:yes stop_codon:yes gene_type:complete
MDNNCKEKAEDNKDNDIIEDQEKINNNDVRPPTHPKIKHICFSGGGLKGMGFIGVYKALKELDLLADPLETIVGTSIGSFAGLLLLLGYTPDELYSFITSFEYNQIKDFNFLNFLQNWGIESGTKVVKFFSAFLNKKTNKHEITFKELYELYPTKFTIVASNLRTHTPVYFNHETSPDEPVIMTLRKSISIPIFFTRIYDNPTGDCWVDGGLLDNFPIKQCPDSKSTLGICFKDTAQEYKNDSLEEYLLNIFSSLFTVNSKKDIDSIKDSRILMIDPANCNGFNFYSTPDDRQKIYDCSYKATINFFDN